MAQEFDALANAVKMAESRGQRFDPKNPEKLLTSPAGAEGEMQVLPKTQRDPGFGVAPAKDRSASEIARVGRDYLQAMLNKYGNEHHALVAYNWGPKNADNWLASGAKQEKLPPETQKYIQKVQEYKGKPLSTGQRVQKMTEMDLRDAGPSYKAALAMSFLVDDKDVSGKKPEEDIWKEDETTAAAEPAYQSPLAGMELSYKSPFQTEKQPVHLSEGGDPGYRSVLDRPEMTQDMSDPRYRAYLEKKQALEPDFTDIALIAPAARSVKSAAEELAALGKTRTPATDVRIGWKHQDWESAIGKKPWIEPPPAPIPTSSSPGMADKLKEIAASTINDAAERALKDFSRIEVPIVAAKAHRMMQERQAPTAMEEYMQIQGNTKEKVPFKRADGSPQERQAPTAMEEYMQIQGDRKEKVPLKRADGSPQEGEVSQGVYLDSGMKTESSNASKRSAKEMLAYMQAQNPSVVINKTPMDSNTMGYVNSLRPDIVNINPQQSPAREELTKLHELEHSMAMRSGDILGRPNISGQDNAYRAFYLLKKDWTPLRQFAYNMASNKDKLEKFFGQPMDSGYLNVKPEVLDQLRNQRDALEGLAEEQMASLSALEQTTGKFLTQDPEMRKLFPSTKMMAVYDALTGPRQTRMDARDLPPHTPTPSYMYQDNPVLRFIQKHLTGEHEYGIPIKRSDGSPQEGEVAKPYVGNPNIQRQGAAARRLAAMRDVNTLPDPKTYAATAGFLGTPFEEQGWSVLHPQRQAIQNAADTGFVAGTAAQVAPVVGPAAKALAKMTGSAMNEALLAGKSLTPGISTPSPINFAVRPEPGGFFLHSQRQNLDDVDLFLRHFAGVQKESTRPLDQWMYKRYSNYMRGQMGTEMDPLVKAADQGKRFHFMDEAGMTHAPDYMEHVPWIRERMGLPKQGFAKSAVGSELEQAIDATISPIPVGDVGDLNLSPKMKELQARNPDAPVYELMHEEVDNLLKPQELKTALSDMLRIKELPPEYRLTQDQLNKMTLPEASEKAAKFNRYVEEKQSAQMLKNAQQIPVYKTYPDKQRWLAPEDVSEDIPSMEYVLKAGKDANWCTKNESNCLSYASGEDRVLILSNEKGQPIAQVSYENRVPEARDWLDTLDVDTATQLGENYMIHQIERLPEYQKWAQDNTQKVVTEIKGRHNETNLSGPILDKVRDLIRTGDWFMVKDLKNAQLIDTDFLLSRSHDFLPGHIVDAPRYEKAIKDRFGTLYLTPEEVPEAKAIMEAISIPPENRAKGGSVERVSGDNRRYL